MKVLAKDKIVETFKFPFSEALSFSILIWTMWGFIESFFWQRAFPYFDTGIQRMHHLVYIAAFFIYLAVASVLAAIIYSVARWILFTMDRHETTKFRSATLSVILGIFFFAAIPYVFQRHLSSSAMPGFWTFLLLGVVILTAASALVLLYRSAANEAFRIRRSGTTMTSIFVLSLVLSFVSFPLFSAGGEPEPQTRDLKKSINRLMVMHYIHDLPDQE